MDDLYREEIIDHYKNPRNFGKLESLRDKVKVTNASCGDVLEIGLQIEKGRIKEFKFKGEGCALSMASASMLSEEIKGKKVEDVKNLKVDFVLSLLGIKVSSGRIKCVSLALKAVDKIISKKS